MESTTPISAQMLDEDLQIVQATLATVARDIHHFSGEAGLAILDALQKVNFAREEVARVGAT
jgi:hypothetical protein